MKKINLVWLSDDINLPQWEWGEVFVCHADIASLVKVLTANEEIEDAEAWLFWDASLEMPDHDIFLSLLKTKADVWHAGLSIGMAGQPEVLKFVSPDWMLAVDVDPSIDSLSWRLSLRCCLIRTWVLSEFGFPQPDFESLDGASLDLGFRYIKAGAIIRFVPGLVSKPVEIVNRISYIDQIHIILDNFKKKWAYWVLLNTAFHYPFKFWGYRTLLKSWSDQKKVQPRNTDVPASHKDPSISIILPTLKRYDYLPGCLESFRHQVQPPKEIIIVDQNDVEDRRPDIYESFLDLPLKIIWQDAHGQSTARNCAIKQVTGEWIYFADDDSIYPNDALQKHFDYVTYFDADGSTGISIPPRPYQVPEGFNHPRVAHDLDTGNCLIKRSIVLSAGGFDSHFNFGKGADLDLGVRIYKQGGFLIHNPEVKRIHFKAPGGLREYGVLWDNRSSGRTSPKPPITKTYFFYRHFPKGSIKHAIMHSLLFSNLPSSQVVNGRDSYVIKSLLKEIVTLPLTIIRLEKSIKGARKMLREGPKLIDL